MGTIINCTACVVWKQNVYCRCCGKGSYGLESHYYMVVTNYVDCVTAINYIARAFVRNCTVMWWGITWALTRKELQAHCPCSLLMYDADDAVQTNYRPTAPNLWWCMMPILLCKRIILLALAANALHILCRMVMKCTGSAAVTDCNDYAVMTNFW